MWTCNPETGRWLQQDPYDEFFLPYCAMGNNPANFTDPTGGWLNGASGSGFSGFSGGGNGFGDSGTQPMDGQANAPSSGGGGDNSGFSNPIFTNPLSDIIYPDHSKNEWKGVPYALPTAGGEFDLGGGITLEAITLVGHRQEESSFAIPIGLAGLLSPEAISAIEGAITFGATMGAAIVGVLFIPGDTRVKEGTGTGVVQFSKTKTLDETNYGSNGAEHRKKSKSKQGKHQKGRKRNSNDRGGEKGDARRTRHK